MKRAVSEDQAKPAETFRIAADIHKQDRTSFTMGPPPYRTEVTIRCTDTGREWTLRISRFISQKDADTTMQALLRIVASASEKGKDGKKREELMGYSLAWFQACSDMTALSMGACS